MRRTPASAPSAVSPAATAPPAAWATSASTPAAPPTARPARPDAPASASSTERGDELVELIHRLAHPGLHSRGQRGVAGFLRRVELARDQLGRAVLLLERDGDHHLGAGDRLEPVGVDQAGGPGDLEVFAGEREALAGAAAEDITPGAARLHLGRALEDAHAARLRRPPAPDQIGLRPRVEDDVRRGAEGPRNDELALALELHLRAIRAHFFTFFFVEGSLGFFFA